MFSKTPTSLGIPDDQWSPKVKPLLQEIRLELDKLKAAGVNNILDFPVSVWSITLPSWVDDELRNESIEGLASFLRERNIPGEAWTKSLEEILDEDTHLEKCLVSPFLFARVIDLFFSGVNADASEPVSDESFESWSQQFIERLYEEPFTAQTYSHVFNFSSEIDVLRFGDLTIRKIDPTYIRFLHNELTFQSFIHPFASGEFFVVQESTELIPNDTDWIIERHITADSLIRIFQYYKDGVVHINYSTIYFRPIWLNSVRKLGSMFLGNNRRIAYEMGDRFFSINQREYEELITWWKLYQIPDIQNLLGDDRNNFGKVLEFAGAFFESSLTHVELNRRLIDLSISLEAIFSPGNSGELVFQLSQFAAEFIGDTSVEKLEIFKFMKEVYGKRSTLLHGHPKAFEKDFLNLEDVEKFSSYIRRALLRVLALYINGEAQHKEFIETLRFGLFDPSYREKWLSRSNLNTVIEKRLFESEHDND